MNRFILPVLLVFLQSCSHNSSKPATTRSTGPVVTSWQCQVDGVPYSGTVDTTFVQYVVGFISNHPDTMFYCTGTTLDKGANIHLQFRLNRYPVGSTDTVSSAYNQLQFAFDTCSENLLQAFYNSRSSVQCVIDSLDADHVWAHFSGTLTVVSSSGFILGHSVTNGVLVADWNSGDHDANSFSYTSDIAVSDGLTPGNVVVGYFHSARMVSNTVVLDGAPAGWSGLDRFRLLVRTGGTIQPGIYHSENGDVGLSTYNSTTDDLNVTDSAGSLTVTITKVSGNTVYGNFSGFSRNNQGGTVTGPGAAITNGSFAVRVRGYVPEADSGFKWGLGAFLSEWPLQAYHIYGGNITGATYLTAGSRPSLTINGESDNGASTFVVVVSSDGPIQKGVYPFQYFPFPSGNNLDKFVFASPEFLTWYNQPTELLPVYDPINFGSLPTEVVIDSISDHYVRGEIRGQMMQYWGGNGDGGFKVQEGRFEAKF
jgi:hypothetical protein